MRPLKLRTHLLLLVLGTLFPIVVFAAIAGWMLLVDLPQAAPVDTTGTVSLTIRYADAPTRQPVVMSFNVPG